MTRVFATSIALAPALVVICAAWLWAHIGIALLFTVGASFGAGYIARWLDEPETHSVRWSLFP